MKLRILTLMATGLLLLAGCANVVRAPLPAIERDVRWAVLPLTNDTETPLAGNRAAAIAEAVLRAGGIQQLVRAPQNPGGDELFDPAAAPSLEQGLAWARKAGARYVLAGTVTEWRYKVGVDGEPAVGLTLQLIDAASGQVLWSASGARTAWSRSSLAGTAQSLIETLLAPVAAAHR